MGCGASAPPRIVVTPVSSTVVTVQSREPMDETHMEIEETFKEEAETFKPEVDPFKDYLEVDNQELSGAGFLPMTATPGRWRKRSTCQFSKVYQPDGWNLSVRLPIRRQ